MKTKTNHASVILYIFRKCRMWVPICLTVRLSREKQGLQNNQECSITNSSSELKTHDNLDLSASGNVSEDITKRLVLSVADREVPLQQVRIASNNNQIVDNNTIRDQESELRVQSIRAFDISQGDEVTNKNDDQRTIRNITPEHMIEPQAVVAVQPPVVQEEVVIAESLSSGLATITMMPVPQVANMETELTIAESEDDNSFFSQLEQNLESGSYHAIEDHGLYILETLTFG
ncbi:hypothetical protein L873DRAFT_839339 [Choiromyces venosus 120613-1]|uniref:Uncharacterized protein n=1 Tax=Choiromyces venosus 120613-1 TaxID=1336337 RepID=A0A3N4JVR3_9PEZI|nr:hypothetical protein L873DRAFT_839339 [Choiromyces venosus 120613-1]